MIFLIQIISVVTMIWLIIGLLTIVIINLDFNRLKRKWLFLLGPVIWMFKIFDWLDRKCNNLDKEKIFYKK